MNYIDQIAMDIHLEAEPDIGFDDVLLYRAYALLLLAKGETVTNEDVHNAWALWAATHAPKHPSLVPYSGLSVAVQELDTQYAEAIRNVARRGYWNLL